MSDNPKIAIVIATCNPTKLLERTLVSLAECVAPPNLRRVIVAENGPTPTARDLVDDFQEGLPIEYHFFPNARKCGALNRALAELDDEFIIYFDDDVRIHPETLTAYAEALDGRTGGIFFGGRCRVDRVDAPEDWLDSFLPAAAKGWAPASEFCELKKSGALGFNWAAFANDLRSVGGYDERCGPGTAANSDEINVQERLLESGVKGYFVPDAVVWHYVPRERCSAEWVLEYKKKDGVGKGIAFAEAKWTTRWKQQLGCRAKLAGYQLVTFAASRWLRHRTLYHCRYKMHWLRGKLEGMRLALSAKPAAKTAAESTTVPI